MIMGTLPLAMVGSIWLMYLEGYNFSVAVGVGFIALAGGAVEIGDESNCRAYGWRYVKCSYFDTSYLTGTLLFMAFKLIT